METINKSEVVIDEKEIDVSLDFRFSVSIAEFEKRIAGEDYALSFALSAKGIIPEDRIELVPSTNIIMVTKTGGYKVMNFVHSGADYLESFYAGQTLSQVTTPHLKSRFCIPVNKTEVETIKKGAVTQWQCPSNSDAFVDESCGNTHSRLINSFEDSKGHNQLLVILGSIPNEQTSVAESNDGIQRVISMVYFVDEELGEDILACIRAQVQDIRNSDMALEPSHIANSLTNALFIAVDNPDTIASYDEIVSDIPGLSELICEQVDVEIDEH